MTERRYGDEEVREIFSLATMGGTRDPLTPADSNGLTLDELQRIGQEAGIEPMQIAQAAKRVESRGKPSAIRRSLGLPVGTARVVDLPRAPTDREWEQLISEFRTTFGAQGNSTTSGGLRDWSNGELHISVEPTERGEQLRLSTLNEGGQLLNGIGLVMGGFSLLMTAVISAAGKPGKAIVILGMFGGIALTAFAVNLLWLPRWARKRERQFREIAEHTVKLLSNP